ncbi:cell division control protein 2 homolog isoform X2 [Cornus florida]|uniref:cell division control protein 2 homolog isoform X2 n=1 Tax=Cornus florida TaxID=4283 RepID=UPI0028978600|nr:cell division control protein 2 homolog isoform X2 [Cornus florida]
MIWRRLLDILNVVQHGTIRVRLVFDYLDINLKKFMDTHSETAKNPHVIKRFLHQILSALAYCHSHNILHQNLKPQYLFIDSSKRILKLAFRLFPTEFQSAGVVAVPSNPQGFEVGPGVLWYHPLEVLLGNSEKNSNPAADVWSAGCIFAEMLHPLLDDSHEIELAEINNNYTLLPEDVGTLDEPNDISLAIILLSGIFHDENNPKNLTDAVPNLESAGLDLLSKMLCTVPEQRITACDALKHPYFDDVVSSPIGYNFLSVFLSEVVLHQLQNLLT